MSTIKEVAMKANVSTATVSRVLNDNYPTSDKVKKQVFEAIKELGYRPNAVARSLKTNKTNIIGLVVPDISNIYFMEIARGLESVISQLGYTMIFCSTDENEEKEVKLLKTLNEKRVDFVILASCMQTPEKINELVLQGLNIIMVDTMIKDVNADCIVENNYEASYELMCHALKAGHKRCGIINGLMTISTARERYDGFKKALEDFELVMDARYIIEGNYTRQTAYENVKKVILENRDSLPTLFYSTNNEMTEGLMIALQEEGIKIPDEISVVSFGDITVPKLVKPNLTIVAQDARAIGKKAGEVLIKSMEKDTVVEGYRTYVIPSNVIIQNSVKLIGV